jgi:hypothetical protein
VLCETGCNICGRVESEGSNGWTNKPRTETSTRQGQGRLAEWGETESEAHGRDPPPPPPWLPPRHATSFRWPRCRADRRPPAPDSSPPRSPLNPQHHSPIRGPGGGAAQLQKLPKSSPLPPSPLAPPSPLQPVPAPRFTLLCGALPGII